MAGLKRDKSTPESRRFWECAEEAARKVATWPAWKRLETDHNRLATAARLHYHGEPPEHVMEAIMKEHTAPTPDPEEVVARIARLLSEEGCSCDCGCDSEGHDEGCEPCFACRVDAVLRGKGGTD